jgi:hypothetical protein
MVPAPFLKGFLACMGPCTALVFVSNRAVLCCAAVLCCPAVVLSCCCAALLLCCANRCVPPAVRLGVPGILW